jgi:hypothetical protein
MNKKTLWPATAAALRECKRAPIMARAPPRLWRPWRTATTTVSVTHVPPLLAPQKPLPLQAPPVSSKPSSSLTFFPRPGLQLSITITIVIVVLFIRFITVLVHCGHNPEAVFPCYATSSPSPGSASSLRTLPGGPTPRKQNLPNTPRSRGALLFPSLPGAMAVSSRCMTIPPCDGILLRPARRARPPCWICWASGSRTLRKGGTGWSESGWL